MEFLANAATNVVTKEVNIGACDGNLLFIFETARLVIRIITIAVPFALIIWGSLDFFKAVIAGDEKEMKQKRKPFVQRLIAAIIVLLLPSFVNLIVTTFGGSKKNATSKTSTFYDCWSAAKNGANGKINIPDSGDSMNP